VGRRNLTRVASLLALALLIPACASAGTTIRWRLLADGPAAGSSAPSTHAYAALTRAATAQFSARLTAASSAKLAQANFARDAVVAIFAEFGCRDSSIFVSSLEQRGTTLAVKLVERRPAGTMQCMALYQTYRFLLVSKSLLKRPYPTRASVTLA
jgi:hypothetical protein